MPENEYIENVFIDFNKKVFRNIGFEESKEDIIKKEKGRLTLKDTVAGGLFYEYIFPADSSNDLSLEYAEIKYFLLDNLLDIITISYYLNNKEDIDTIQNTLSRLFTLKYGKPYTDDNNYLVWDAIEEKGGKKTIKYDIAIKKNHKPFEDLALMIEFMRN